MVAVVPGVFVHAQTAGNWNFNGTVTGTPGANITVSATTFGSSIVSNAFNGGTEFYGQDGWPTGALDPNAYLQFSLTPATSYYLVLNSVTLVIRRSTTGTAAGSGPMQYSLRSSLDGYASNLSTGTLSTSYITFTVPLPAMFQSLSSAVTFRLYGYSSNTSSGGSNRFVYDNISLQGQAIPGVLAIQNILLTAKAVSPGSVGLQWNSTGFDAGTDFVVERSEDGSSFTDIDRVQSSAAADAQFQYEDASAPSTTTIYYRILAVRPDGANYLSSIVVVNTGLSQAFQIRGVVAGEASVRAIMKIPESGQYRLCVYSMNGMALLKQVITEQPGDLAMDIPFGNHAHGIYILTVSNGGQNISRKFVY
jgi:hypothetical protein